MRFGYPLWIPIGTSTLVPDSRDLTQQDFSGDSFHRTYTANLTWQISRTNKANLDHHLGRRTCTTIRGSGISPEAATYLYSTPDYLAQGTWTNPLRAACSSKAGSRSSTRHGGGCSGNGWESRSDRGRSSLFSARGFLRDADGANFIDIRAYNHQYNMRFAANYVTGSHAFKVGMQEMWGTRNFSYEQNQAQFDGPS